MIESDSNVGKINDAENFKLNNDLNVTCKINVDKKYKLNLKKTSTG